MFITLVATSSAAEEFGAEAKIELRAVASLLASGGHGLRIMRFSLILGRILLRSPQDARCVMTQMLTVC
ncbi:hypothetical protein DM806_01380 [Sphingobium lactosutens]|uniref:hypothetical protein n=1 Tax=Sphingobium lactosutens TaxID=522773 RepID=UPI0015C17B97|nr:hypothetical protein [Sphingobium lactosutens]NWK94357.1 hypothetical protein [Sphingobium lactosutens]